MIWSAEQSLDEGEEIELAPASFDEAIEMIRDGDIRDAQDDRHTADVRAVPPGPTPSATGPPTE